MRSLCSSRPKLTGWTNRGGTCLMFPLPSLSFLNLFPVGPTWTYPEGERCYRVGLGKRSVTNPVGGRGSASAMEERDESKMYGGDCSIFHIRMRRPNNTGLCWSCFPLTLCYNFPLLRQNLVTRQFGVNFSLSFIPLVKQTRPYGWMLVSLVKKKHVLVLLTSLLVS